MLSKPDDWKFNFTNFKKSLGIGDKAIRSIIKTLEDFRYLKRERIEDKIGHYELNYFVYEEPYDMELKGMIYHITLKDRWWEDVSLRAIFI